MNKNKIIDEMYESIGHKHVIDKETFKKNTMVLLDMELYYRGEQYLYNMIGTGKPDWEEPEAQAPYRKEVCNSSMGHGKSTAITAWLKRLVSEKDLTEKIPVLLVIKNEKLAETVHKEMLAFDKTCIALVNAETKVNVEEVAKYHQIVIIMHKRLELMETGKQWNEQYKTWHVYKTYDKCWGKPKEGNKLDKKNFVCKRHRICIIDEMPIFETSNIFTPKSMNEWYRTLVNNLDEELNSNEVEGTEALINAMYFTYTMFGGTHTERIIEEDKKKRDKQQKQVMKMLNKLEGAKMHEGTYQAFLSLEHFKKIITGEETARIDRYKVLKNQEVKLMYSKKLTYDFIEMNVIIWDGTADFNKERYIERGFVFREVPNINDYSRVKLIQIVLNTSIENLNKPDKRYQSLTTEYVERVVSKVHKDYVLLCRKDDVKYYLDANLILEQYIKHYQETLEKKAVNLLSVIGQNFAKDAEAIVISSLPRKNADYYKLIAIAMYDDIDLSMNEDKNEDCWFLDPRLEAIYYGDMFAELKQGIYRGRIRNVTAKDDYTVYLFFDDSKGDKEKREEMRMLKLINECCFKGQASISQDTGVFERNSYNRGKKIEDLVKNVVEYYNKNVTYFHNEDSVQLSKMSEAGKEMNDYLKRKQKNSKLNNWDTKKEMIMREFAKYGFKIFVDETKGKEGAHPKCIKRVK